MFQKFGKDIPQSLVDMVSGIMEAKVEPDAPDADAIARKKRLQAIKDKQEDDAAERGTGEKKSSGTRTVAGTSYGGAKQKDEPMEEEDLARVRSLMQARKKQYHESEEFELHLDLTEGIESFGLKASDEQKKKAKETGEKFVAAALAKRGKTKKESMMGAASSNLTGMGESRGHKIIADKLKQIDRMSSGIAPDQSANIQSIKDKLKDSANLKQVEIVKQKDTSVKEEVINELSKKTLGSYIKKASSPTGEKSNVNLASRAAAKLAADGEDDGEKDDRKAYHRSIGIGRAAGKLAQEATDTETKDASGKVTSWQHTGDWKKSAPGHTGTKTGKGKVAHLSDFARKKSAELASEETIDEVSADLVGRYSDKANKEYNDPKTSERKKVTRRAGLMLGYNKAKGRANVPATYKEEVELEESHDEFDTPGWKGMHPDVAKAIQKHKGHIGAIMHNTGSNALAAVVDHPEDNTHHVHFFINNKKVHTTIHPTFGDAEAHGVKTVTTKAGLKHLSKMHGLMEDIEYITGQNEEVEPIDELSKGTLSSYVKGAASDLPRLGNTLGRLQTHGKLKDTEKRIGKHIAKRYHGIERATNKLAKEDSKSPGQDEDNHMSPGATARG
jgi:hypothetical protein